MRLRARIGGQAGGCHTHMRPRPDEITKARDLYNMSPIEYLDSVDWLNDSTTIVHGADRAADELSELGRHGCAIAHCPRMLSRLGATVPPVIQASRKGC